MEILPAGNGDEGKRYPAPLASHEEVIKDHALFFDTVANFHSLFGTKYMVPVIGGKELDLYILYVEVTKRGGFDKVVSEKKWREISSVFKFTPTTTSASYALRRHYLTLLYHYEQAYFFRLQSPLFYPKIPSTRGPITFKAKGTIEGKFDCGYLVSVKLGSEVLSGVLYHPREQPPDHVEPTTTQPCTAIVPYIPRPPPPPNSGWNNILTSSSSSSRRRRGRRGRDPDHPKPNRSGYNFFFAEKHSQLKSMWPEREREFTKMIGESWNNLSPEERTIYQGYGLKDKERYQEEMKEYKERQLQTRTT